MNTVSIELALLMIALIQIAVTPLTGGAKATAFLTLLHDRADGKTHGCDQQRKNHQR